MEQDQLAVIRAAVIAIAKKLGCNNAEAAEKADRTIRSLKRRVLDKHNEIVRDRRYARFTAADETARTEFNAEILIKLRLKRSLNRYSQKERKRAAELIAGASRKSRKDQTERRAIDLEQNLSDAGWLPPRPNKRGRPVGWTKQQVKAAPNDNGSPTSHDKILAYEAHFIEAATAFLSIKDVVAIAAECIKEQAGDLMDFDKPVSRAEKGQADTAFQAWGSAVAVLRPDADDEVIVREMRAYRNASLRATLQEEDRTADLERAFAERFGQMQLERERSRLERLEQVHALLEAAESRFVLFPAELSFVESLKNALPSRPLTEAEEEQWCRLLKDRGITLALRKTAQDGEIICKFDDQTG
jgi:hypothetical protein